MDVKIINFSDKDSFVDYEITGLSNSQLKYIEDNLDENLSVDFENELLNIRMFFSREVFPFKSQESKLKIDDFKAREEIEMNIFLSSFLEDL